jgi:DNA polymerase I-like protein with 3'-5' exonuclease and polymerase domains
LFVEVHDSCTFQAVEEEIPEIVEYSTAIFESVRFPWQTIPTPVEWEIGKNWYELEALKCE